MAIVIKASYETDIEGMEIDRCLSPLRLARKDEKQNGRFRRSYYKSKELLQRGGSFDAGRAEALQIQSSDD